MMVTRKWVIHEEVDEFVWVPLLIRIWMLMLRKILHSDSTAAYK